MLLRKLAVSSLARAARPPLARRALLLSMQRLRSTGVLEDDDDDAGARHGIDTAAFLAEHQIELVGDVDDVDTTPLQDFRDITRIDDEGAPAPLPGAIRTFFRQKSFAAPTPIQAQALPLALQGRDVVGIAQTGSGKTLGFLLPMLWSCAEASKGEKAAKREIGAPRGIVLAPTRELAQQIEREAAGLAAAFGSRTLCVYGGQKRHIQERAIWSAGRKLDVVVGTPGRLADFMRDGVLKLKDVRFLVADEADRMLDMGFEPQLREIVDELGDKERRQTLLFSATWPEEVQELADEFVRDAVRIHVGGSDELVANRDIAQHVRVMPSQAAKLDALYALIEEQKSRLGGDRSRERACHTVVFCNRKADAKWLAQQLERDIRGRAVALHGDLMQNARDHVLGLIKGGRAQARTARPPAAPRPRPRPPRHGARGCR